MTSNPLLSGCAFVTTQRRGPADAAPATEAPGKASIPVPGEVD
jgi:hypothetical protein